MIYSPSDKIYKTLLIEPIMDLAKSYHVLMQVNFIQSSVYVKSNM